MMNIGARKFGGSQHHAQHVDVPGGCSRPVQPVDYLIGCFGNQNILTMVWGLPPNSLNLSMGLEYSLYVVKY